MDLKCLSPYKLSTQSKMVVEMILKRCCFDASYVWMKSISFWPPFFGLGLFFYNQRHLRETHRMQHRKPRKNLTKKLKTNIENFQNIISLNIGLMETNRKWVLRNAWQLFQRYKESCRTPKQVVYTSTYSWIENEQDIIMKSSISGSNIL